MFFLIITFLSILAYLRPRIAVLLLVLLIPSYLLKSEIFSLPTNLLELSTAFVAVVFLIKILFSRNLRNQVRQRLSYLWENERKFIYAVAFFLTTALIATVWTQDLRRSAGIFKGWFIAPLIFAILLYLTTESRKQIFRIVATLAVSVATLSVWGIIEHFRNLSEGQFWFRLDSVFTSPNEHALLAGPVVILSLGMLLAGKKIFKDNITSSVLILTSLINIFSLYLTYSFGGYLALVGGAGVLLWSLLKFKRNKKIGLVLGCIFLAATLGLFLFSVNTDKFQRDFFNLQGESSLRARLELWETSKYIIKKHPLGGTGLGNFVHVYETYVVEAIGQQPLAKKLIHAHNIFLDFAIDLGIPGLTAFIVLLYFIFNLVKRLMSKDRILSFAVFGSLIAILLHGLVDTPYFKNDLSYLFWLLPSLLLVGRLDLKEE